MVNKRKRAELSDSETDDVAPGRQTLPVANLPCDFDQEPQDGMQYLFLVRRDARRLPHVTRARNPYEVPETEVVHPLTPLFAGILPCEKWRTAFQTHFSNLRKNLGQATIHVSHDHSSSRPGILPEKKDRDAWWMFLAGYPESAWSPKNRPVRKKLSMSCQGSVHTTAGAVTPEDTTGALDVQPETPPPRQPTPLDHSESTNTVQLSTSSVEANGVELPSPPEVTPSHLWQVDHRMSIHLLMYFTRWINVHLENPSNPLTCISVHHARWMFALLTKIEDQLSADEMNLLRNLARACLGLIRLYRGERVDKAVSQGVSVMHMEDTVHMSDASCWMIFTAVAGYWGQRDLWVDAEATLAST